MPHGDFARVGFRLEFRGFLIRHGNQQTTAGLGVVEQGLKVDGKLAINGDVRAEVKEVIRRSAGESVGISKFSSCPHERDAGEVELQGNAACGSHLGGVTEQTETGDVGCSVQTKVHGELGSIAVEAFHPVDSIRKLVRGDQVAFERGSDDAGAKGFGEEQAVARARARFGEQMVVLDDTEGNQTKFGFIILDRVPACNDNSSFEGFFGCTANNGLGDFDWEAGRQGRDVECEEGFAAHRVDVRKRVGGGDGAVIVGVIHNRSEEVDRGNERLVVVEAPNSSIIG